MDWAGHLDTAAFAGVLAAASAVLVPRIIERVPEPIPDEPEAEDPDAPPRFEGGETQAEEPKELYADIAQRRGLIWRGVVAGLLSGALVGEALGWSWTLLVWLPVVPLCLALGYIDWRTRLLPTWLIRRTYVVVVALVLVTTLITRDGHDLVRAAVGWAGSLVLYFVLWFIYPRGLGFGDVRLSGILGIVLGYAGTAELVVGVYAGFLLGGVGGALLSLLRIVHRKNVPFGPFMLVGAVGGLLVGDWLGGLMTG